MLNHSSQELLQRYRDGEDDAAAEMFSRYVKRLISLVRKRVSGKLQRRIDPEDVIQSAYRSFFVSARDDRYVLSRAGDLWRLLAAIALNKLHRQVERHTAQRRNISSEQEPLSSDSPLDNRARSH